MRLLFLLVGIIIGYLSGRYDIYYSAKYRLLDARDFVLDKVDGAKSAHRKWLKRFKKNVKKLIK